MLTWIADWGQDLANGSSQLDTKTWLVIVGMAVGASVFVYDKQSSQSERTAATESDIRVLSREVSTLKAQVAEVSDAQQTMDRRQIQYHSLVMEKLDKLGAEGIPSPYEFGGSR